MRCKSERAKLPGRDCWECEKYYKNLSLSKDELQERKNKCSRHRSKYERPKTPEGFWDPEIPETQYIELKGEENDPLQENDSINGSLQAIDSKISKNEESITNVDSDISELKEKKSLFPAKSKLHSKIEELQECNDKLRSERKEMKHKLEETMSELKNVRQLNERLQTALIDKTNECETTLRNILTANINMQYENNFPPIGKRQSNGMIHIGRNEWISEIHYNRVCNSSKTPRQFASNIIFPVFDDELLMNSTITGYTSSRHGEKKTCNKLDEKKLGACEDIYKHWINNTYKKKFADAPHKDNTLRELSKFYYYVGKKLADFKKSSRDKTNEKTKKRQQNSDENNNKKSKISSEETNEQIISEEDVNVGNDEDSRLYDYSPEIHSS